MIAVARTLKRRLDNLLTHLQHPITNALNESVNPPVEKVKRLARGLSQPHEPPDRIYFHCGKLDHYPRPTTCWGYPK